jgi:hypothetical protein
MVVAGSMHILHNATKDMTSDMPWFMEGFYEPLKAVVDLMGKRHFRKFYISRCMTDEQLSVYGSVLQSFTATLSEHRWGYIVDSCKSVEQVEAVLRLTWDLGKLRGRDGQGGDGVSTKDIETMHKFVTSSLHWSYLRMLLCLAKILDLISAFLQSCPCHSTKLMQIANESWHMRFRAFTESMKDHLKRPCPMKGRRAPELAAGKLHALIESWLTRGFGEVMQLAQCLPANERTHIVEDWRAGRGRIEFALRFKFAFTQTIPFLLCSMCLPDENTARDTMRQALQQYAQGQGNNASENPQHHRWSLRFLQQGSRLHDLLLQWLGGTSMTDPAVEDLRLASLPLKFLPLCEHSIERNHAVAKMFISKAKHHAEAYFSLGLRWKELEDRLDHPDHGGDFLIELGALCKDIRAADHMAAALGMTHHPVYLQAIAELGAGDSLNHARQKLQFLRPIIYRCDIASQYKNLSDGAKELREFQLQRSAVPRRPVLLPVLDAILTKYASEHLQSNGIGPFYSCSTSLVKFAMEPLASALQPQPHKIPVSAFAGLIPAEFTDLASGHVIGYDDDESHILDVTSASMQNASCSAAALGSPGEVDIDSAGEHVFFRMIHNKPKSMHSIRYGSGVVKNFDACDMVVALQQPWSSDDCVCVNSVDCSSTRGAAGQSDDQMRVWSLKHCVWPTIQKSVLIWQATSSRFCFSQNHGWPAGVHAVSAQDAVDKLVIAGAFPGCEETSLFCVSDNNPLNIVLQGLQEHGLVQNVGEQPEGTQWLIASKLYVRFVLQTDLSSPTHVFKHRTDVPLHELSTYELLDKLLCDGWQARVMKPSKAVHEPPYTMDPPRTFVFWRKDTVPRLYLLALLGAEAIIASGFVESIAHGGALIPCTSSAYARCSCI